MSIRNRKVSRSIGYAVISIGCLIFVFDVVELETLREAFFSLRPSTMAQGAVLILLSVLFALVRFRSVLKSFGYLPTWRDTFVAFAFGQASNLVFFNIIGQSLSRAAILSESGVPAGVSVAVTYCERVLAAGVLFLFSVAGGWLLFAEGILDLQSAAAYLVYVFGSMLLVSMIVAIAILGVATAYTRAKRWMGKALRMWQSAALTVLSQMCMALAYLLILHQVAGEPFSLNVLSAIAVIMFASSLPISFSGWGVRELTSIQILGAIGISSSFSATTAVAIGLISLFILVLCGLAGLWVFARRREGAAPAVVDSKIGGGIQWTSFAALLFGVSTSVLIFFQVRVAVDGGAVTANIADVVALTALGLAGLLVLRQRDILMFPKPFLLALLAISLIFVLALSIGFSRYGLNQWAIVNRGLGWIIILGYLAVGGALVWGDKTNGRVLVLRCFVLAGAAVGGVQLLLYFSSLFNLSFPADTFIIPLRGYAGNSNAFALQMVMVAIAAITAHRLGAGFSHPKMLRVILVITALATYFSLSRSGMSTFLGAMFLFVVLSPRAERRERLLDGAFVVVACLSAVALPQLISGAVAWASQWGVATNLGAITGLGENTLAHMNFNVRRASSDSERWQSLLQGWELWRQYPIFGAGLGAFVQIRADANLPILVIHSIPVWAAAELGIFGLGVIGSVFAGLIWVSLKMARDPAYSAWGQGMFILLGVLAVSGMVHDFFFQRGFWFLLGIFVGVVGKFGIQKPVSTELSGTQLSPGTPSEGK